MILCAQEWIEQCRFEVFSAHFCTFCGPHPQWSISTTLFGGCIITTKGYFWSFWVQNLFSWFLRAYTILYRYTGVQHCSAAPAQSRQKDSKIGRIPGLLMVWEKARVGGTTPSLFWGWRIQRKMEILWKILYRQVHWCAALFCRTSPEQAKIPQNRPNFKGFYYCWTEFG